VEIYKYIENKKGEELQRGTKWSGVGWERRGTIHRSLNGVALGSGILVEPLNGSYYDDNQK
jgi:hypothetical protein